MLFLKRENIDTPTILSAVDQLIQYNLGSYILHIVHLLHPKQLIFGFQRFRYALLLGKLLYKLGKEYVRLPIDFIKMFI